MQRFLRTLDSTPQARLESDQVRRRTARLESDHGRGEGLPLKRALRSFEWTPGTFSAREVPATEPVYGPEQADGTCTCRVGADLGGARRRRVARPGRRVKRRREASRWLAGRTWRYAALSADA